MERRQLDHYCRLLSVYESGIRMSISNTLFELSYQFEGLKTEIITNKISLKKNGYAYLVLAETEIRKTIGHFGDEDYVESALGILKKYNIKLDDFLNHKIENKEFEEIFRREVNFDDKEKITELIKHNISGFIVKPFNANTLKKQLNRIEKTLTDKYEIVLD